MDDDRRMTLRTLARTVGSALGAGALGSAGSAGLGRDRGQAMAVRARGRDVIPAGGGLRETIFATDFIKGDDATNCDTGLSQLHTRVSRRAAAGNTSLVIWPAGRYVFTSMPNWAIPLLQMHFEGEVWLINNGRGDTLTFDGGETGPGVFGLRVTGFPRLYGGRSSRHGVYARSIHRSQFEFSCRGAGERFSGFHGEWLVSNEIRFSMNFNEGGLYNRPAQGMLLTARAGLANFQSSYNSLYEPEFSGLPRGLVLDAALGNKVFGGAFQANDRGLELMESAWANKFFGSDFESNETDALDSGRSTQFYGCDFERGPVLSGKSRCASIVGGETNSVDIKAGADRALISGVIYNRLGGGGINDAGMLTRRRDLRDARGRAVENMPSSDTELMPKQSPFRYTNESANNQAVLVDGGNVKKLRLCRKKEVSMPVVGQYVLGPGDGIIIEFEGRPPAVALWSL